LAYMDSVHFFKPRQFRTAVYHEILIGYLDYVKQIGSVHPLDDLVLINITHLD